MGAGGASQARLALPNTFILLLSSVAIWRASERPAAENEERPCSAPGPHSYLELFFVAVQLVEWKHKSFGVGRSSYASLYYITTGFHLAHVVVGIAVLAMLFIWTSLSYFTPTRRIVFTNGSYYWHFVDAIWLLVFATYYITPYLGFGV